MKEDVIVKEGKKKGSVWLFFLIAFGFSWLFWVPLALAEQNLLSLPDGLYQFLSGGSNPAAWGPFVAAFLLTAIYEGWSGIKALVKRGLQVKIGWKWYLVAFLLLPLLIGMPLLVAQIAGEAIPESWALREAEGAPLPIFAVIAFFIIFFTGGPLQEEFGWRGYATDRLQEKFSALWTGIIMGLLWATWHLPLLFVPREESYYNRPAWGLFLTTTLVTILFTWIYNNTNRSIFATLIFHTMFNWSNFFFPTFETDIGGLLFFGLAIILVGVIVWQFGQKKLRREVS